MARNAPERRTSSGALRAAPGARRYPEAMSTEFLTLPIDTESAEQLGADGLRFGLVETGGTSGTGVFARWLEADARGFHDTRPSAESVQSQLRGLPARRTTAVWDDSAADAATPVATVSSWPTALTVPGADAVVAWAVSSVTVAPTHRRRGVARAMLEAELRTARRLGLPVAILTVSEATIYGRFGFAPAVMAADWTIDTRRATWTGRQPAGRLHLLAPEQLAEHGPGIADRVRTGIPGEIEKWDYLWKRMLGTEGDKDHAKKLRAVRYDDAAGVPQGFAVYTVTQSGPDFAAQTLTLEYLSSATDDAYAALWRYAIEMDLVTTVTAPLRSVDEPVAWMVADPRAVKKADEQDHLWTRILDLKAALEARRYRGPALLALDVTDPLGFASGRVLLDVAADGSAVVSPLVGDAPAGTAEVDLTVNELGALYLGGVSAVALARAGRLVERRTGSVLAVDAAFRTAAAPWLSVWF